MTNNVKGSLLMEHVESYSLEVRPVDGRWEILCPPGPLAQFLLSAAYSPQSGKTEYRGGDPYVIIRFTADLDREIVRMIQTLIDLRYQTGRVQLELWADHL